MPGRSTVATEPFGSTVRVRPSIQIDVLRINQLGIENPTFSRRFRASSDTRPSPFPARERLARVAALQNLDLNAAPERKLELGIHDFGS